MYDYCPDYKADAVSRNSIIYYIMIHNYNYNYNFFTVFLFFCANTTLLE